MTISTDDWTQPEPDGADASEIMYVDVDGYEGPLDLLLEMARRQKVDLANISVLALAEQYLAFIETVREKRIEIAADYLVMAAWLAYLKSRLMVPQVASDDEPSGEQLAAALQFRLKRLEAMRAAAAQLVNRPRLGVEIFARGAPEPIEIKRSTLWDVSLYELLKAYSRQRERGLSTEYKLTPRVVWGLQEARGILERLIGHSGEWVALDAHLAQYLARPEERATILASSFSASLEMVRQGHVELRQHDAFGPILLRRREDSAQDSSREGSVDGTK